jgi:kumamolisin
MSRVVGVALGATIVILGMETAAVAQPLDTRHLHSQVVSGEAKRLNALPTTQRLHLDLGMSLRNEAELDKLMEKLYDPRSPLFHKFLTAEEFTDRFAPTEEQYAAALRFAESNGMKVTDTLPTRMLFSVSTDVATVEKAFHVTMSSYQHPSEPRSFYSPDQEPTVDPSLGIRHIGGLDNFSIAHPAGLREGVGDDSVAGAATGGTGPNGYFLGSDIRAAYYTAGLAKGATALTGTGQSVGLFELGGYNPADVTKYFTNAKQTNSVTITNISIPSTTAATCTSCGDVEQVLDIEQAISMAPGLSSVRVYVGTSSPLNDSSIFAKMASDNISKQLACSWGWSPADPTSDDPYFKEFAVQGQNLFVAAGDNGAYTTTSVNVYPADDMYVTSVGGTVLTTASAGGAWSAETAWSKSGGGISPNKIAIPSWQPTAIITTADKASKTYRNVPDVAAEANTDNYVCYTTSVTVGTTTAWPSVCTGSSVTNTAGKTSVTTTGSAYGGTSYAAPRWAAFLALVNQQAVADKYTTVGFINPALYLIGEGKTAITGYTYAGAFHDITSGSNGTYSTETGYDLVTGWGSPIGYGTYSLIAQLLGYLK